MAVKPDDISMLLYQEGVSGALFGRYVGMRRLIKEEPY
jgi:hypothetical protein